MNSHRPMPWVRAPGSVPTIFALILLLAPSVAGAQTTTTWGYDHDFRLTYEFDDNVNEQLIMFRDYVKNRYGTAEKAMAFWKAHNWY